MINFPTFAFNKIDPDKEQEGISQEETLTLVSYQERMTKLQAELEESQKSILAAKPKAEAFDIVTQALAASGFDPEKMTYIDQANMVVQLSVSGLDGVLAQKLELLDGYIAAARMQVKMNINKLSEIVDDSLMARKSIHKVREMADNSRAEIACMVGDVVEDRVRWHENQWHDARHIMYADSQDPDEGDDGVNRMSMDMVREDINDKLRRMLKSKPEIDRD